MFIVPGDFACLAPRASANILVAGAHGGEEHPNSLAVRQRQGETLAVPWLSPLSGLYFVALCHPVRVDLGSSVNLLWKYLDIHSQKDVSPSSSLMLNLTKSALKMNSS